MKVKASYGPNSTYKIMIPIFFITIPMSYDLRKQQVWNSSVNWEREGEVSESVLLLFLFLAFSLSHLSSINQHEIYGANWMSVSPRPLSYISLPAFSFDLLTIILRTYTTVKKPDELTVRGRHRGRARGKQQNDKHRELQLNTQPMLTWRYRGDDLITDLWHFFISLQTK